MLIDANSHLGTISSSRWTKEATEPMGEASQGLLRLRPVTFRYRRATAEGMRPRQYGLIAEEVAEIYPDLVAYTVDGQTGRPDTHAPGRESTACSRVSWSPGAKDSLTR